MRCRAQGHTFSVDFNLTQQCDVSILGIGGRTVDKIMRHGLHKIRRMAPEIVILELGSNDLCDESCDAESVSLAIEALVELLHKDMNVRFTILYTILYLTTQHPGVIRNSFKHVRETKSIENKRNSLKLPL